MVSPQVFEAAGARRLTVTTTSEGWKLREEEGPKTVRATTFTDWHRVERAVALFLLVNPGESDYSPNL
jgi:hypothetical protein